MITFTIEQLKTEAVVHRKLGYAYIHYEREILSGRLKVIGINYVGQLKEVLKDVFPEPVKIIAPANEEPCRQCGVHYPVNELIGDLKLCENCRFK